MTCLAKLVIFLAVVGGMAATIVVAVSLITDGKWPWLTRTEETKQYMNLVSRVVEGDQD